MFEMFPLRKNTQIGFCEWMKYLVTIESEQCCDDLNPVDSCWLAAGQLSQCPQLVVLGNYVTRRLR